MGKIKVLDISLSNKIAAGEVVERPASVVKELVENSIDAGASKIIIKIKEAGRKEIVVSDNGSGMDKEDAILSFARHATSKISSDRDLFRISTLGFRGEALASISSVSEIDLDTSLGEIGTHLEVRNGKIGNVSVIGINRGTTIKVRNLFYNTPARLKFLKSDNVEFAHISDVVMKEALANPKISFTLINDERVSFFSSGNGNVLEIVASLYGIEVAKSMNKIEAEDDDFTLKGYTSSLGVNRANKNAIITILNGRCVKLVGALNALIEGYKTYLADDRYPIAILDIEVDPQLVDVNVHPSKQEVRLSKENELKILILDALKKLFMVNNVAPRIVNNEAQLKPVQGSIDLDKLANIYSNYNDYSSGNPLDYQDEEPVVYENSDDTLKKKKITPIGQYIAKYVLASDGDNLYLIDQHAAAERYNYEKFLRKLNNHERWDYSELLVPIVLTYSKKESALIEESLNLFNELGIHIEVFGENSFRVTSMPLWMKEKDANEYLKEIINEVLENHKVDLQEVRFRVIATMACKASLKANQVLSIQEMQVLIDNLLTCDNPYTCPHGRPTVITYSTYELDKMFKRIL